MGLVYHYTSPEAALSILRNKVLWFSDCEFMNDPGEIAYCYRLYDEAWAEVCLEAGIPEEQVNRKITSWVNPYECESPISEELTFSVPARYYSFSTCAEADNLAMWSCYACRNGETGYALGFDADLLTQELQDLASSFLESEVYFDSRSGWVCYAENDQGEQIKRLILNHLVERGVICERRSSLLDRVIAGEVARGDHWEQISALAPFIKRPEFSYEREYRFVIRLCQLPIDGLEGCGDDSKVEVRQGWRLSSSGTLVPYYELSLGRAFSDVLKEVQVMHLGESGIAVSGMRRLLDSFGYQHVLVREADVRLRKS